MEKNMLDQFIEEYVPVMLEELRAVKKDKSILVAKDLDNRHHPPEY